MTAQDFVAQGGIGNTMEDNPFRNWSFIVIPYATGDFHSGTGTYEGEKKVYHIGYKNYSAYIEQIKHYIGEPDTLLVTGFSAGGFATSLLADDVIDRFPNVKNVTVCVDSSLLLYDGWHETAVEGYYFFLRILSEKLLQYRFILCFVLLHHFYKFRFQLIFYPSSSSIPYYIQIHYSFH